MNKRIKSFLVTLVALVFVAVSTPAMAAATADEVDVHPAIEQALREIPGGEAIDATHAVWPELDMDMVVLSGRARAAAAVASCPTGRICAYTSTALVNLYVSWGTCGVLPIPNASVYPVRSFANARSSGYAQARNGTTVLATAYAGSWSNVVGSPNTIRCVL